MREIKFRGWDKVRKRMFTSNNNSGINLMEFSQYGEIETISLFEYLPNGNFEFHKVNINEVELLQYTGLKDINDKEIYEGDILNNVTADTKYGVVSFEQGCFIVRADDGEIIHHRLVHLTESCEVIGNIFENPELLKGE